MKYDIIASIEVSDPQHVEDVVAALNTLLPYIGDNIEVRYETNPRVERFLEATISHGTLRTEDLVQAFEKVAREVNVEEAAIAGHWYECQPGDEEDLQEYLAKLVDILEEAAPEGYYFGTIEGDGSDFGFWQEHDGPDRAAELDYANHSSSITGIYEAP